MNPIGILGGTFDPIHEGHLAIAERVLQALSCDHIEFIPCFLPSHRDQPIASPEHRLAMTILATQYNLQFQVNPIEIKRKGISYTVDTLTQLRQQMPTQSLCFILGSDAFAQFNHWHKWQKIIELAHLIIVTRANSKLPKPTWLNTLLQTRITDDHNALQKTSAGKIYFQPIDPIAISATQIRYDIAANKKNIVGLPAEIRRYIALHAVYMQNTSR